MDEPDSRSGSGRFVPGQTGNPGGRPRMDPEVREMLRCATPKAAKRLIDALDSDKYVGIDGRAVPDWKTRITAAEAIFDRVYGKAPQAITGEDGAPLIPDSNALLETLKKLAGG